ncbi:threonine aldolase family protein [Duganella violaceipulchra]|uniref:Threonine aldolase n=1 Tax=Duganella violaceipulchra TaxID=2849652 RepID=A0AA41L6Z4_9BURK|nr:beta-eliminating lyase-related protein [Duganella violaceicalia]MBV6323817.1 threonine aldolase [Duganella violaceicalia]MCP2007508.1 threonine aldolase [Duganella violaceicalia]
MTDAELRLSCTTHLPGHRQPSPAQQFAAMSAWCEANGVAHDTYGNGTLIQDFEQKLATLLGFESALFCISGTMAQATALRIACSERGSRLVALHPTSHILRHERGNHQLFDHFQALQIGDPHRPWTLDELKGIPDKLGAATLELPMREIGGQCPAWEDLADIKTYCREQAIHLHLDGARLFETAAAYDRPAAEIAAGFDSVYISMYKGIGGMGGAMLLGSEPFIAKAQEWFRRQGGNVYQRTPYVVAAAMQFDARLAAMPKYFHRTEWLYEVLRDYPKLTPNPARPQASMLHLHLPVSRERANEIRNRIAEQHGVWLFNAASHAALPDRSSVELYIGDNLLNLPDQRVREILTLWSDAMSN